jgi:8-oxo-dGTP pyrophosphatase MutT (NUDIX family)
MIRTTCGVLVTDGARLLLGQAPNASRWDIPKGLAEPGEAFLDAAVRELREETGLVAEGASLTPHGVHRYLPGKQLALFRWRVDAMPDPAALRCASVFRGYDGRLMPEFARFAVVTWEEALGRVGKNMGRVLSEVGFCENLPRVLQRNPVDSQSS